MYRHPKNSIRENLNTNRKTMPDELHRVEFRGNLAGQYRENVMYWRITGATSDLPFGNANSLAIFLDANLKTPFLDLVPPEYSLDAILVRRVGPTAGQYAAIDYEQLSQPGTGPSGAVSQQLCPCITLIPPMDVKSAGRIFLPAVAKTDINLNVPVAGYITRVNTFMTAATVGGSVAGGTANIVIFSRKHNTSSVVASWHVSPVIGYQRRRATPIGI